MRRLRLRGYTPCPRPPSWEQQSQDSSLGTLALGPSALPCCGALRGRLGGTLGSFQACGSLGMPPGPAASALLGNSVMDANSWPHPDLLNWNSVLGCSSLCLNKPLWFGCMLTWEDPLFCKRGLRIPRVRTCEQVYVRAGADTRAGPLCALFPPQGTHKGAQLRGTARRRSGGRHPEQPLPAFEGAASF